MPKVFLSYVNEDRIAADRLLADLEARGIEVWQDRVALRPGQRWKAEISRHIREGDFFVACFSEAYASKEKSYMNEELTLAIEQLRLRPFGRAWFLPVRLDSCEIPEWPIGAGDTLHSLQWVDLHDGWDEGLNRLVNTILPAVEPFVHRHYCYRYRVVNRHRMEVRVEANLRVTKDVVSVGGAGWTERPNDLAISIVVLRAGEKIDTKVTIAGLERVKGVYWWTTHYEPALLKGDDVTVAYTFWVETEPSDAQIDSFHALRPIQGLDWEIAVEPPLLIEEWRATCDYVPGFGDGHVLREERGATRACRHSFGKLAKGAIYYMNWRYA